MHLVVIALKTVCYAALLFVGSGVAALVFVNLMGGCPRLDEGSIQCISPAYREIGSYGLGIVYLSLFTGLPALFAIAGLVFLIQATWRWLRGAPAPPPLPLRPQ